MPRQFPQMQFGSFCKMDSFCIPGCLWCIQLQMQMSPQQQVSGEPNDGRMLEPEGESDSLAACDVPLLH